MARPNRTKQAVLGFLTWGQMSGYDIKRAVEGSISNFWSESYGQIYPILSQLEAEGSVRKKTVETEGGRPRNVYTITAAGRQDLRRWFTEPTPPLSVRHEPLLKLFFGNQTDAHTNVARIEEFRRIQVNALDKYAGIAARLRKDAAESPDLPYWLMTLRYGELEGRARLQWCDETLATLRKIEKENRS